MTTHPTTPKRWRSRFSVRTLVILVTFVCFYFGMWEATKRQGVADVNEYLEWPNTREINPLFLEGANASAPVPLIAVVDQPSDWVVVPQKTRYYYFWFFGYVARLPYERDI